MVLRKATIDDIELLIRLRIDYLTEDKGKLSLEEETAIKSQLRMYLPKHISNNTFIGILAEIENIVVSTAYLAVSEIPANSTFITGITGTLMNVLTYPEYRRRGIATKVIEKVIFEAMKAGVSRINLSSTSDGIHLYKKMGFKESSYIAMSLQLN